MIREGLRRGMYSWAQASAGSATEGSMLQSPRHHRSSQSRDRGRDPFRNRQRVVCPRREILTLIPGRHYDFGQQGHRLQQHRSAELSRLCWPRTGTLAGAAYRLMRDTSRRSNADDARSGERDAARRGGRLVRQGSCPPLTARFSIPISRPMANSIALKQSGGCLPKGVRRFSQTALDRRNAR